MTSLRVATVHNKKYTLALDLSTTLAAIVFLYCVMAT